MIVYAIWGEVENRSFDGRDLEWPVKFCFYDREQAEAHIREIQQEIEKIWESAETEVEWKEYGILSSAMWRKMDSGNDWSPQKLSTLDHILVGWQDFRQYKSFPTYRIIKLELQSPL